MSASTSASVPAAQNRAPQVGDIVTGTYLSQDFTQSILEIKGNMILFGGSGIIWQNNRWEFTNGIGAENVRFFRSKEERLETSVFTGSHLTDMHVLAEADDQTFHNLCRTNLRLRDICMNPRYEEQLYEMRVQIRFPVYYQLFVENWGHYLDETQLAKITKPTWKTVYQNLIKMKEENLLYLLTMEEPVYYPIGFNRNRSVDLESVEMFIPIVIMGKYPDIFKFIYTINPGVFRSIKGFFGVYYSQYNLLPLQNLKEVTEMIGWLLELDQLKLDEDLIRYATLIGYGPFIKYLIEKKGVVLNMYQKRDAVKGGAGDILDLLLNGPTSPSRELDLTKGMDAALRMGNIEGLEGFHQRGIKPWRKREDLEYDLTTGRYSKETGIWLKNHGYI